MIQKFRRRMTLLFTAATGSILIAVLCVTFFYQFSLIRSQDNERFQNQLLDLTHRLEANTSFSDDWLAKLEADGHFIIHIEENNIPLFFSGSWTPRTERETLIRMARETAMTEKVDVTKRPFSSSLQKSSFFSLTGKYHDTYEGTVIVLSTGQGFRSLIFLADTTGRNRTLLVQVIFFLLLGVCGLLGLFLVSRCVVNKAVRPLEEYHQKQTDFVAAASHELRSPLSVIQTCASAVTAMPEKAPEMAELIQRECIRSGSLIKNLLLLASADAGSLAEEMQPIEIDTLLFRLFESYEPLCRARHIHLKLILPEDLLSEVYGNSQWIYQILSILLDNAVSHAYPDLKPLPETAVYSLTAVRDQTTDGSSAGKKAVIQLTAAPYSGGVCISVIDHGRGIPDEQKQQVFDRFFRGDPSRNKKDHSGLGLSIASTLSAQMHLSVTILDTPGGGTTFQIRFPSCGR